MSATSTEDAGEMSATSPSGTNSVFRPFADAQRPRHSKTTFPNEALAAGMPLPMHLRESFPRNLIGKPIDDIDSYYANQKTFMVIGHHWIIYRFDADSSLCLMSPANRIRHFAISTVTHAWFHYFIFTVLVANGLIYTDMQSYNYYYADTAFQWVFTAEVVIKVIAYGCLLNPFSYLRQPWNGLDFIVTLFWIVSQFIDLGHLGPIRIIRLVNFFTYSRLTFATSAGALLKMRDVVSYAAASFFFYTIFALNFFTGLLSHRCVKDLMDADNESHRDSYSTHINNRSAWLFLNTGEDKLCGNMSTADRCPDGYTCHQTMGHNPNYGYTNFDNLFYTSLSIFRLMARDYWEGLLAQLQSTYGSTCIPFFLMVIIFGSFLLINLVVAHLAIFHGQLMELLKGTKSNTNGTSISKRSAKNGSITDKELAHVAEKDEVPFADDVIMTEYKSVSAEAAAKEEPEVVIVTKIEESDGNENQNKGAVNLSEALNPLTACCSLCMNVCCTWQCCDCCIKLQEFLSRIVFHRFFDLFICFVIALNTFAMALDHHHMSSTMEHILVSFNYLVLLIYTVEAILKILAMSPNRYFRDSWCIFEFVIVLLALMEFVLENVQGMSLFRALRLFRCLRLAKFYRHFNVLLRIGGVDAFVLYVFVFTFALSGMILFSQSYHLNVGKFPDHEIPRYNFRDFLHSVMIIVRVLCGNWIDCFWDCTLAAGWFCIPFFFVSVVLGKLVVYSLFISMIMMSIDSHNLCSTEKEARNEGQSVFTVFRDVFQRLCSFCLCCQKGATKLPSAKSEEQLFEVSLEGETKLDGKETVVESEAAEPCCSPACFSWISCGSSSSLPTVTPANQFWNKWQIFRNKTLSLLRHRYFQIFMSAFIIITSLLQLQSEFFKFVDLVVFIVYSLELLIKLLGIGCKKYFSTGWNQFDFAVTVLYIFSFVCHWMGGRCAVASAARILKLFPYHKQLQVVIESVAYDFAHVFNAIFACFIVWLLFAIVGVQVFAGRFYSCVDIEGTVVPLEIVHHKWDCIIHNYTWTKPTVNFDNTFNALVALLQVATRSGEIDIYNNAMDNRGLDSQPSRAANIHMILYFISFLLLGVLCSFACLVRAFIKKINIQKRHSGGYVETLMTAAQRADYAARKKTLFKTPSKTVPEPSAPLLKPVYHLVTSRRFYLAITLVLIFNALALALHYPSISPRLVTALQIVHTIFFLVFFVEIILKVAAFGSHFFKNSWDVYEFIVAVPMVLVIFLEEIASKYVIPSGVVHLLIVLRLVRRIKCLRRVLHTFWVSRSVFYNAAFFVSVVMFFYSRIGVNMFGHLKYFVGDDEYHSYVKSFTAISITIQMTFGAAWDRIYSAMHPLNCASTDDFCPSMFWVSVFILSYLFLCFLVLVHIGTVLLLEHYERLRRKVCLGIVDQDLDDFNATWRVFDPYGGGLISRDRLADFLETLVKPFKPDHPEELDVPVSKENRVSYEDVLRALLRSLDVNHEFYVVTPRPAHGEHHGTDGNKIVVTDK